MKEPLNIEERKPVWKALSEFYLDTTLRRSDFKRLAAQVSESPYSFSEISSINKYEVFPALQPNLVAVAGEWAGFDEQWLIEKILTTLQKRNAISKTVIARAYRVFQWMHRKEWDQFEQAYYALKKEAEK